MSLGRVGARELGSRGLSERILRNFEKSEPWTQLVPGLVAGRDPAR